jgi:signal transduction histidine kinase/CHASE3 domain sensor protein
MKAKKLLSSTFLLKGIFVLSIFVLVFISAVSYKHATSLTESSEALQHSYAVRNELEQVISFLKDAETGQRGYLLSHDSSMLEPYLHARDKVNKSMYALSILAQKKPEQVANLDTLYRLITDRFAYMNLLLKASDNISMKEDLLHRNLIKEKQVMDAIRNQVNHMIGFEQQFLKERKERFRNEISFTPLFTFLLLIFSALVFAFAYFRLNKQIDVLLHSNDALLMSAEAMSHAEKIGGFSTWHWNHQRKETEYSVNMNELLGHPLGSEPILWEQLLERVHPEDREGLEAHNQKALNGDSSPFLFRVYRYDGDLRYFCSAGKMIHTVKGSHIYLGVTSDITEQYKKNLSLQERNIELEQTNRELASFNYVASHDLQEPLRIIQTYISRISEREYSKLSESAREYFERIRVSANRMQILINDLLTFSRTNKAEKVFERCDLNELLELAKQDLATLIEEKKAIIESDVLPRMHVIAYQIKQLFLNLLGNSLKYASENRVPYIRIRYREIKETEYPQIRRDKRRRYACISVYDNGMGFEQEFAENIFVLFKRLHQKNEYPGTGIGLSICKKISEIHSGGIVAEGFPGHGAHFHVILPL